jgi:enoyl-CoA hydratase/carnithine racemase
MEYQRLKLSINDRIARISLASPAYGNRIDQRLLRELDDASVEIGVDQTVVVAVIDAEGDDFCLGWEESTRTALSGPDAVVDPFSAIASLACPTVAAVRGRALSGGLELALACDFRIADSTARLGMPEVAEGHMPLAGATQRLPRIAGKAAALSMLLLGEEVDAERAYQTRD